MTKQELLQSILALNEKTKKLVQKKIEPNYNQNLETFQTSIVSNSANITISQPFPKKYFGSIKICKKDISHLAVKKLIKECNT